MPLERTRHDHAVSPVVIAARAAQQLRLDARCSNSQFTPGRCYDLAQVKILLEMCLLGDYSVQSEFGRSHAVLA